MNPEAKGLLFDAVRCIGCRNCIGACLERQGFPGDPEQVRELSATAFTAMFEQDGVPLRDLCRHCLNPSCVSVCPVGALTKHASGPVTYVAEKCMGCRYCMVACPFNVPRYEWLDPVPRVRKCDMCLDRQLEGKPTACASVCPTGATLSGTRAEVLAEAHARLAAEPEAYEPHVFGEHEVGGTSVLFLVPPGVQAPGFTASLSGEPLPALTFKVLEKVPLVAIGGTVGLAAFAWVVRRRNEALARRAGAPGAPAAPNATRHEQE